MSHSQSSTLTINWSISIQNERYLLLPMSWTVQKFLVRKKCICVSLYIQDHHVLSSQTGLSHVFITKKLPRYFLVYTSWHKFCTNFIWTQLIPPHNILFLLKGSLRKLKTRCNVLFRKKCPVHYILPYLRNLNTILSQYLIRRPLNLI